MSDDVHRSLVAERVAVQRQNRLSKRASATSLTPARTAPRRAAPAAALTEAENRDQLALVPCRYYVANGICPAGNKCRYSHHPALRGMTALLEDEDDDGESYGYRSRRPPPASEEIAETPTALAPNVDDMSYEQLLNLCDQVGKVKVGVPPSSLSRIPVITVLHESADRCSVCLEAFAVGSKMRVLPCGHPFHLTCIDEWLEGSKKCPNCNKDVTEGLVSVSDVLESITEQDSDPQRSGSFDDQSAARGSTPGSLRIRPPTSTVVHSPIPKRVVPPPKSAKPVWRF